MAGYRELPIARAPAGQVAVAVIGCFRFPSSRLLVSCCWYLQVYVDGSDKHVMARLVIQKLD
ncbi:hypothetical protein [Labrenzia sp. OB1]|uniref:hypothetical protein n=1 Tax=Labrenzia sp. OB1 TaxID=1561204 RepID=UPI0007B261DC|nr:hypothetical protein [Labrenzia sp. OB1]KZM50353.1 hypothetical protein OA90_10685 [Labrenzia sp. OB1]